MVQRWWLSFWNSPIKQITKEDLIRQRHMPPPEHHVTSETELTTINNVTLIRYFALIMILYIFVSFIATSLIYFIA